MNPILRTARYVAIGIVILVLGIFAGWYLYLRSQKTQVDTTNAGRGLTTETPSFASTIGSTYQNIASVVSDAGAAFGAGTSTATSTPGSGQQKRLWHVDNTPVAGLGFVNAGANRGLYFAERASGYILSANPTSQSITRLSATLRPKVYRAYFSYDGSVIQQTLDASSSVQTFIGTTVSSSTQANTPAELLLVGANLDPDIRALAINPASRDILYITNNDRGGAVMTITPWSRTPRKVAFVSGIGGWLPLWLPDGRIIVSTNPAEGLPGYSYLLQPKDSSLAPLLRNLPGLIVNPHPAAAALLYSTSGTAPVTLYARQDNGTTTLRLPFTTVASKCVWGQDIIISATGATSTATSTTATSTTATSTRARKAIPLPPPHRDHIAFCAVPNTAPASGFLGQWLRGEIHTSDDWWKVDTTTGSTTRVYSPSIESNIDIDVQQPTIDTTNNYLAFINGRDQSLWMLRINP